MKRVLLGASAILAAAILPFSGVSAAGMVDYEKSVGQVEGADTINWVVEATSDGGYVVGGQTVACYKYIDDEPETKLKAMSLDVSDFAEGKNVEAAPYEECIKYYQDNKWADFWNYYPGAIKTPKNTDRGSAAAKSMAIQGAVGTPAQSSFEDNVSNTLLAKACGFGQQDVFASYATDKGSTDEEYAYRASCIDYIAKFKTDGTKEWLTTFEDSVQPVAVKKVSNGYRLMTSYGMIYNFSNSGAKGTAGSINAPDRIGKAYFNNDGSSIVQLGHEGALAALDAAGNVIASTPMGGNVTYVNLFPAGDSYVAEKITYDETTDKYTVQTVDISKNLGSEKQRQLEGVDSSSSYLLSANKQGDVMVATTEANTHKVVKVMSFDKNGKKLGEYNVSSMNIGNVRAYKDFTVALVDGFSMDGVSSVVKMINFNRDMSVKYEYNGGGNEFVADVAELKDASLAGVGLALKGSSKIPVTGEANGGYLRLTGAVAPSQPAQKPAAKPNVKNPNTFDGIDAVAVAGGVLLLGLGLFMRKNTVRR